MRLLLCSLAMGLLSEVDVRSPTRYPPDMAEVIREKPVVCKSDIASLWNIITDTDRLNRAVGNARVKYADKNDDSAARYIATTTLGGFAVTYDERPFEWSYLEKFRVLRQMQNGPLNALDVSFLFAPREAGGTTVTMMLRAQLRVGLLKPIVAFQLGRSLNAFSRELMRVDAAIAQGGGAPPTYRGQVNHAAISALGTQLHQQGENAEIADKLVRYVLTASDYDVARIRPFVLAEEWKLERFAVLSVFLAAVRVGLLTLQWELICPSCRAAAQTLESLEGIGLHGRCQLCEIKFGVDLDEALEATFTVHSGLRDVDAGTYCIAGPARTRHVLAQMVLPRHDLSLLIVPPEQGRYRLFVRGGATATVQVQNGGSQVQDVELSELHAQSQIILAPRGGLRIHNGTERDLHAKIEVIEWVRQAATATHVLTSPRFARDFADARLPANEPLMLHNVGVLILRLAGDAELIPSVLKELAAVFERHNGGVGQRDAHGFVVTFSNPLDAINAMRTAHQELARAPASFHVSMGYAAGALTLSSSDGRARTYSGPVFDRARELAEQGGTLLTKEEVERAVMAGRLVDTELREEMIGARSVVFS